MGVQNTMLGRKVVTAVFVCSLIVFGLHVVSIQKSPQNESNKQRSNFLKELELRCSDVEFKKSVEYRSNYIVLRNYVQAEKKFKCLESVTVSVPGDYRFLDNILPLVERWQGPISVALYAPGYDFFSTLQSIAYLRKCHKLSRLVKELVTFHLFFDTDHMPQQHDKPLLDIYQDEFDCVQKPPFETLTDDDMYKQRNSLFFPINVARNVAKLSVHTYFVFPLDIELYPTRNLISKFFNFVARHPEYFEKNATNVFVFPLFEILEGYEIPETKTALQQMLTNKIAFGFHERVCSKCHLIPRNGEWIQDRESKDLNIFTSGKRQGEQLIWEPFFICTQKEPLWDERLNWEGQGNKMCQAYYLCLLDYDFLVFDNAFLIHKPGVKKVKIQNIKYQDQKIKNNIILLNITTELTEIYGQNDQCRIHSLKGHHRH